MGTRVCTGEREQWMSLGSAVECDTCGGDTTCRCCGALAASQWNEPVCVATGFCALWAPHLSFGDRTRTAHYCDACLNPGGVETAQKMWRERGYYACTEHLALHEALSRTHRVDFETHRTPDGDATLDLVFYNTTGSETDRVRDCTLAQLRIAQAHTRARL